MARGLLATNSRFIDCRASGVPGHLMIVRFESVNTQNMNARRTLRAAVAVSVMALAAMAGAVGVAHAQGGATAATAATATAASGAAAAASGASAAAALPVVGQYTVRAGQSLHDVAVDVTQSHDKAVLARASQALFDANPAAFMKHDPSRLKVGAVLNVPGTPDMASDAAGASAPAAGASAPVAAANAPAAAVSAAPASGATGSNLATHSATNAAATGATTAIAANSAPASAAAAASAGATAGAVAASSAAGASASLEAGANAANASAASGASAEAAGGPASASDAHSWSGAIQAAPTASGASAAPGTAASAPVTVSSLQQLLALKNHVLMALQQHGIGKQAHVAGAPAGATIAHGGAPAGGAVPGASGAQPEVSPVTLGVVAALVLAFVALIVRLLMRKRRKPAPVGKENAVVPPRSSAAAEVKPATPAEPPQRDAALDHAADAASLSAAAELGASALPPEGLAGSRTVGEMEALACEAETQDAPQEDAAHEAASAEPRPVEPTMPGAQSEPQSPAAEALAPETQAPEAPTEPEAPAPAAEPQLHEPRTSGDETAPDAPPESLAAPAVPPEQKEAMPHLEVPKEVPQEFPKAAVDALGGLDMPLPPRVETPPPMPGAPLSTEPVATPDTIARQAMPFVQPPVPPAGEAIEAGTAGAGAIAGLGAPRFGTLTLDFDLDLPADSAEPLPVFTPEQLSRIARNKLDLAHEYIALGDLAGARALINEVIESNDPATRTDAQALLSKLSPLS